MGEARGDRWLQEFVLAGPDRETTIRAAALCVLIGEASLTQAAREWLRTDGRGYILAGPDLLHGDTPG